MGLSAGPVKYRAGDDGDGDRHARSRKPLVMIISAGMAAIVIGAVATGAAMLQYEPTRQHVEIEITSVRAP